MDALARAGDEGRGTLRKAVGSCEQALIRGYPNGATHFQTTVVRRQRTEGANLPLSVLCLLSSDTKYLDPEYIGVQKLTQGTETSQYLEERTSTETPLVVASERGSGQRRREIKPNDLERSAIAGDSPVGVK